MLRIWMVMQNQPFLMVLVVFAILTYICYVSRKTIFSITDVISRYAQLCCPPVIFPLLNLMDLCKVIDYLESCPSHIWHSKAIHKRFPFYIFVLETHRYLFIWRHLVFSSPKLEQHQRAQHVCVALNSSWQQLSGDSIYHYLTLQISAYKTHKQMFQQTLLPKAALIFFCSHNHSVFE